MLAQTTPLPFGWERIADTGLVGVMFLCFAWTVWKAVKMWQDEKIVDGKKYHRRLEEQEEERNRWLNREQLLLAENQRLHSLLEEDIAPSLERIATVLEYEHRKP